MRPVRGVRPVRVLRRHGSLAGVQVPRRVRARRDQPVRRMHEERAAPVRRRRLLRDLAGREDASDARVRQEQKLRRLHGGVPWQLLVHGLRLRQLDRCPKRGRLVQVPALVRGTC